jgi:myo-inositol-1(or 4)-monophosphatase
VTADADPQQLLALATETAVSAGEILTRREARPRAAVATKSTATDMVSEVDRASEDHIVSEILRVRPGDGILGEEGTSRASRSGVRWVIDPLDGTTNYLYGIPVYAVSIAAEVGGTALAGVVHDPARGETFTALRGGGAWCGDQRLSVSAAADLSEALVGTGFAYSSEARAAQARVLVTVLPAVRDIRRAGAAALDLCWVAAGRLDAYFESGTAAWDRAAGGLIAAEAGAWVGGREGGQSDDDLTVAAAPGLADQLLSLLEPALWATGESAPEDS